MVMFESLVICFIRKLSWSQHEKRKYLRLGKQVAKFINGHLGERLGIVDCLENPERKQISALG